MIKLAIYKTNGTITSVQQLDIGVPSKDWAEKADNYNKTSKNKSKGATVDIETYYDDSLVAWLFNEKMNKKKDFRNELLEIAGSFSEVRDRMRWVEDQLDEMEDD